MGASLIIGDGNWGTKPNKTLGYKPTTKGFTPKEGDHERASIGSYTDRNGVLQTGRVTNYGGNILLNANFAPEELGGQLLINSDFGASLGWSEGAGWTIAGGQASGSGSAGAISQALDVVEGQAYKLIVDIVSMTGVGVYIKVDEENLAYISDTDIGVQSVYFVADGTKTINVAVSCVGGSDTAVLDSFGVQETNSNWISSSESIIFDDFQLEFNATPSNSRLYQDTGEPKIQNVRVKFNISTYTEGGAVIEYGGFTSEVFNTVGEHEVTFTTDGVDDSFSIKSDVGSVSTTLTINSVELQELTETDENVDELRIDFSEDPNGVMLLEDAATNLITYSNDIIGWGGTATLIKDNSILNPSNEFGVLKASNLQGAAGDRIQSIDINVAPSNKYSYSLYVKGDSNNIGKTISFYIKKTSGTFSASPFNQVTLTSEWQKIEDSNTFLADNNSLKFYIYNDASDTADEVLFSFIQVELNEPTSYIPTNGSTGLREADKATNFGTVEDFNSEEGVLVVKAAALANDNSYRVIGLSDGSISNRINVYFEPTPNIIKFDVYVNNSFSYRATIATDITISNEIALKWGDGNFATYLNGVESNVQLTGAIFPQNTLDRLNFSDWNVTSIFSSKPKYVKVYKSIAEAQEDYPYIN